MAHRESESEARETASPAAEIVPGENVTDEDTAWELSPGRYLGDFLEGPRNRRFETMEVFRIAREFVRGFRAFHFLGPTVTVFGSARFTPEHQYYAMARELGGRIADAGFRSAFSSGKRTRRMRSGTRRLTGTPISGTRSSMIWQRPRGMGGPYNRCAT